jgi:hypothetical protein
MPIDRGDHLHGPVAVGSSGKLEPTTDFPYDAVDRSCFGIEASDEKVSFADLSASLSIILGWIGGRQYSTQSNNDAYIRSVAARALGLLFLMDANNSRFESMADVARATGLTRAAISKMMLNLRDQLGVVLNFSGKRAGSREIFRQAQLSSLANGSHSSQTRKDIKQAESSLDAVGH